MVARLAVPVEHVQPVRLVSATLSAMSGDCQSIGLGHCYGRVGEDAIRRILPLVESVFFYYSEVAGQGDSASLSRA